MLELGLKDVLLAELRKNTGQVAALLLRGLGSPLGVSMESGESGRTLYEVLVQSPSA